MNNITDIQRGDAILLYHQIFLALRDDILGGTLSYGAMVPTELEPAGRFAVSAITDRRAWQVSQQRDKTFLTPGAIIAAAAPYIPPINGPPPTIKT